MGARLIIGPVRLPNIETYDDELSLPWGLLFFGRNETRWVGISSGQSRVEFASLTHLGAASGAANAQRRIFWGFHSCIMQDCAGSG